MKWGRKKISSESSRNSLISHVFPVSWLSKFKQKSRDVEAKPAKVKQEGNRNSPSKCVGVSGRGGRFYGGEGDAFWRLSFGEEGGDQGKTSRGDLSSVWYDHSDDKLDVPPSVCRSCGSNAATLESFAVVKCSFDPQKDFRDSMIEMILEKRFSQPQELEELLACYLTLNSDEYHDLIIKVFRQVWFDLNQACFDELQNANYCHN